jgi:hypothetical protein
MEYVKAAEDLTGDLGEPFAPLPESLMGPLIGPSATQLSGISAESKGFESVALR